MSFLHTRSTTAFCEIDHPHVADVSMDESLDGAEDGKISRCVPHHHSPSASPPAAGGGDRPNSAWSLQAQPSYNTGRHRELDDDDGENRDAIGISFDADDEEEIPSWAKNLPTVRLQPRYQNNDNKRGRVAGVVDEQPRHDMMVEGEPLVRPGLPSSLDVPLIDETIRTSNKRSKERLHKRRKNALWSANSDGQEQMSFLRRYLQDRTATVRPRIVSDGTSIELQGDGGCVARRGAAAAAALCTNVFVAAELSSPFKAIPSPELSPVVCNKKRNGHRRLLMNCQENEDPFVTPTQHRPTFFPASRRTCADEDESFVLARPQAVRFTQDRLPLDCKYGGSSSSKRSRHSPSTDRDDATSNTDGYNNRTSAGASIARSYAPIKKSLSSSVTSSAFTTPSG